MRSALVSPKRLGPVPALPAHTTGAQFLGLNAWVSQYLMLLLTAVKRRILLYLLGSVWLGEESFRKGRLPQVWARLGDAGASRVIGGESSHPPRRCSPGRTSVWKGTPPPPWELSPWLPHSRGTEPQLPSAFDVPLVSPTGQTHPSQQGSLGDEVPTGQPHGEWSRAEKDGKRS